MNEEIKEILDRLDFNEWEVNLYKVPITWCEMYDIRDYITNLQEENNFLKLNNPEMNSEHFRIVKENKRKIDNLRKENQKLVKVIEELEKYIKNDAKIEIYGDKTGLRTFVDGQDILNKLTELKGGDKDVEN